MRAAPEVGTGAGLGQSLPGKQENPAADRPAFREILRVYATAGAGRYVRVVCAVPANRLGAFLPEARQAREAGQINPALRLRLTSNILTGQASPTVVLDKTYTASSALATPSPEGLVAALDLCLHAVLEELEKDLAAKS